MILRISILAIAALGLIGALAGCGGDSSDSNSGSAGAAATVPGGGDQADVKVIDGWAAALKAGDIDKAASYWALPSTASNGTEPVELRTREQVIAFNQTLPCGADLVEATTDNGLTTATFDLTDRPGGGCGPGAGAQARTVFKIEDGKIADWRRAPDPGGGDTAQPTPGQSA
ncbi:MAG: hypothetical protein ABR536_00185 [Solirubrobacterales bacterium]